jgi:myo-inositol-1(or 4)-monophosphatase
MDDTEPASAADWLSVCRRSSERIASMLAVRPTTAERVLETGTIGGGGDRTLEIDAAAETIVFEELARIHDQGYRFNAISEERGAVDFSGPGRGGSELLVVIDPIDGSLNAKRGLAYHALAIAVASGSTMADVQFGYVYEFGTGDEWCAELGAGAFLNDRPLDPTLGERRSRDGRLELLGIESVDPRHLQGAVDALVERAYRLRALGALAPALCQVAAARLDGLVSLRRCRAVDVAAAQLIVREAGGHVSFPEAPEHLRAPLDLEPHSQVLAARTSSTLRELEAACRLQ